MENIGDYAYPLGFVDAEHLLGMPLDTWVDDGELFDIAAWPMLDNQQTLHKVCDICGRYAADIYNHNKQLHSGHFFYHCNVCNASYKSYSGLQKHYKDKHPDYMHTCKLCGYKSKNKNVFNRHACKAKPTANSLF